MKIGPFLAVIFAFFLIAIFPYYAVNDEPSYVISDEDGDGITDDKDKCPREAAAEGQDIDEDGCTDNAIKFSNDLEHLFRQAAMDGTTPEELWCGVMKFLARRSTPDEDEMIVAGARIMRRG